MWDGKDIAKAHIEAWKKKMAQPRGEGYTDANGHQEEPMHPDQEKVNQEVMAAMEAKDYEKAHQILKAHREKMDKGE